MKSKIKFDINYYFEDSIFQLPLLILVIVTPIIVYPKIFILEDVYYYNWLSKSSHIDYFSYYSSVFIIICSIFLSGFFLLRMFVKDIPRDNSLIFILLYFLPVIVSTIKTKYIAISIFGFNDRNEGLLVLFCYIVIFLSAYTPKLTLQSMNRLIITIYMMSFIVGLLGILQFFGIDYFDSAIFNKLISYDGFTKSTSLVTSGGVSRTVYSTLYNPNYVGSFAALIFPLSFGLYYFSKRNLLVLKGLFSCLIFALLIGSRSRAGIVGISVSLLIFIIINRKVLSVNKFRCIIFIFYAIIFIFMDYVSGGSLLNKFLTLSPQVEMERTVERFARIEDIEIRKESITILNDQKDLIIEREDGEIKFMNAGQKELGVYLEDGRYFFKNEGYEDFSYLFEKTESGNFILLKIKDTKINFLFNKSGAYIVGTHDRVYSSFNKAPYIGFEGRERFGSSRGYIWSRALPLIKTNILYGHGPDTFAVMFPQEDFIGKLNGFGRVNIIVDKPHNYYIQVAHDTGILSLIALCCLFAIYFLRSFKLFFNRKKDDYWSNIGVSIMVGILGYLIAAFFNDSVVYVAPVFWALLGTGYAINYKLRHEVRVSTKLP